MKTLKNLTLVSILAIFAGCANSDEYGVPDLSGECVTLTPTKTVADITDASTSTATLYTGEDIIEAYVTSSDEGGNFYKSISFESVDGTKGFSIPVDNYNLFNQYEPGRLVYVNLKDLYIQKKYNATLIGNLYNNGIGRLTGVEYRNILKASCTKVNEDEIVKNLSLSAAKSDQYLNMLIEFDNVQFTDASLGKTFFDASLNSIGGATNHLITNEFGQNVIIRVSEFANFAGNQIPSGNGKVRGVMTKYNNDYQFMIRTMNDVQLTGDRVGPDNPTDPTPPTNLLFAGSDFENFTTLNSSLNSFGLQAYASQGIGTGTLGTNSLYLNGTPVGNDYVFTALAASHGTIPVSPTKITFWVKGTSAKSLSLNVYRSTSGYDVFNVDNLTATPVLLNKAALNTSNNGTNSYIGNINTGGQWVKVTLNLSDVSINTSIVGDLFALKVGKDALYNLQIDNIEIQ